MKSQPATAQDLPAPAQLWHDGWHEAHPALAPEGLTKKRTVDAFHERLKTYGDDLRMAGTSAEPLGLCIIQGNEINQLYVSPQARGTGLAGTLLKDGEQSIKTAGAANAYLFCASGNLTAARFYEKQDWTNSGVKDVAIPVDGKDYAVNCIVFRKAL